MAKVIVYVNGGNVQDIIADSPGIEVMLVDYDNEAVQPAPDRAFRDVRCDPVLFSQTVAGTELSDDR
jgi:hypothetical protein